MMTLMMIMNVNNMSGDLLLLSLIVGSSSFRGGERGPGLPVSYRRL